MKQNPFKKPCNQRCTPFMQGKCQVIQNKEIHVYADDHAIRTTFHGKLIFDNASLDDLPLHKYC